MKKDINEKPNKKTGVYADSESFEDFRLPRYREIPDVGLLLEQTARLVNSYLEPLGCVKLTNSMISNYVKQKILARPIKKMYYREQIAALIFIALSKTVLSLEDSAWFLQLQQESCPPDTAYNFFCDSFELGLQKRFPSLKTPGRGETILSETGNTAPDNAFLLNCLITAITDCIYLERMLDTRRCIAR